MDQVIANTRNRMLEAFELVRSDFSTVRTGKASPSMVESIEVSAYGGSAKLKVLELSTIHAQDSQTLVITPFDHAVIGEIAKGIEDAKVGINPIVDENIIRISLPPLTQERREEMVKLISQKAEAGKVMIRQIRHEAMEEIKKQAQVNKSISEDEVIRLEKEIQKLTDEFVEKIDFLSSEKEQELMRI